MNLDFDKLAVEAFGMTRDDALRKGICLNCKHTVVDADGHTHPDRIHTPAGRREYFISAFCEPCYDAAVKEMEGE